MRQPVAERSLNSPRPGGIAVSLYVAPTEQLPIGHKWPTVGATVDKCTLFLQISHFDNEKRDVLM